MHIEIKKGLDIPIKGGPIGALQRLTGAGEGHHTVRPDHVALDLKPFQELRLKLLTKVGDVVKIGQPLVEDKDASGRFFVSPAGGIVRDIRRGSKRTLLDIVIEVAAEEKEETFPQLDLKAASREEIIDLLKRSGLFTAIR